MQRQAWLQQAMQALTRLQAKDPQVTDLRFEARRLMADVLDCSLSDIIVYADKPLTVAEQQRLDSALTRRCQGEPLAYITERWWFYQLELKVSPATLIPRPDTEVLVEHCLGLPLPARAKVLDLGTGTGAIAIALAYHRPGWQLQGLDFSAAAVDLALHNARQHQLQNCQFAVSDWFSALPADPRFDLIVSNPPYIDAADPHLQQGDVQAEPLSALVAKEQGLADLRHICQHAPRYLMPQGWLWLEHGYQQADAVQQLLRDAGFSQVESRRDYGGQWRISGGCLVA